MRSRNVEGPDREVPRKAKPFVLKLANKIPPIKRSKKDLKGLYEVLAPCWTILRDDDVTSIINKQGKTQVTLKELDMLKFGTKAKKKNFPQNLRGQKAKNTVGENNRT